MEVIYKESDLFLSLDKPIEKEKVKNLVKKYYEEIARYIKINPRFFSSLSPIEMDESAASIIKDMIKASTQAGVGPFSSVAGAISWYVGGELLNFCSEIVIENGGDLFLKINEDKKIGLYLGENFSPSFITIKLKKRETPFGVASSSSRIGHSLNFGDVDLVTVIASNSILADSFATSFSNRIKKEKDVGKIIKEAKKLSFIEGIIIAFKNKLFLWGDIVLDV